MEIVNVKSVEEKVKKAKELMLSVGNKIGSVYFTKKENGNLRKMCYRIHVHKPKYAKAPEGKGNRNVNDRYSLLTVFDTNKMVYNKKGEMRGRGAWRSVSLQNVKRICVNGKIYKFV